VENNKGTKSVGTIRFLHHAGASPFGGCATTFAPVGSVSLDSQSPAAPYSTAITDSLNSQVAAAPLRIRFAGVTPVPLPPRKRGHNKASRSCSFISHSSLSMSYSAP